MVVPCSNKSDKFIFSIKKTGPTASVLTFSYNVGFTNSRVA